MYICGQGNQATKNTQKYYGRRGEEFSSIPSKQFTSFPPLLQLCTYMWTRGSGHRKHPEVLWEEKGVIRREGRACGRRRYKKEGEEKGWRVVRGGSSWLHRRLKEGRGEKATQTTECLSSCQNPLMVSSKEVGGCAKPQAHWRTRRRRRHWSIHQSHLPWRTQGYRHLILDPLLSRHSPHLKSY